ncbi:MGMT family protein [Verrucomicrobium sp. BvORR034]|uniref:MGMT family protein n=1 Tax=Verrucomicrobium sp. BvORR034 TaxID=1396418 RepID=UPI000679E87D|nr:MGMT family protein [Verrucomicrobium sp. BvORR034]
MPKRQDKPNTESKPAKKKAKPKPKARSAAFTRIRAEVIRLVALIPAGKFTTYGSIAVHMNVVARHVATVMSHLTEEESAVLPWHRVVSADARISQNMETELSNVQRSRLVAEGMTIDAQGYIQNSDDHFHVVGVRRNIRWSEVRD